MCKVSPKRRQVLLRKLELWDPLSKRDRRDLIECTHMVDRLQTDLKVALSDIEGRIRDNNFLLVVALARRAEIMRLKHRLTNCP